MTPPTYDRHGVYHIATRGGHESTLIVTDDGDGWFEGFRCDVRDITQNGDPSPRAPIEAHNAHVVVGDEAVTVEEDAVDFSVFFGNIRSDRFVRVEFPDVDEPHSNRYGSLADAVGYEPDVGGEGASDK